MALLMVSIVFTLFAVIGITHLAVATTSAQDNQNAADAAALAGAKAFDEAGQIRFASGFTSANNLRAQAESAGACPALVNTAVSTYANKNGSTRESCQMLKWGDLRVTTRRDVPVDGADDGRRASRANWQVRLDNCVIDPSFEPPEDEDEDYAWTYMDCGPNRFNLKYTTATGRYTFSNWSQVSQAVEARLTR